jgi:2',3'-cyclic-nucleotide 2'-phosphodiesterase/3'-nucleotidase
MGWGYYTDIPAGPVPLRNVADLYIYPNTVKAVRSAARWCANGWRCRPAQFNRIDPAGAPEQNLINDAFRSYNFDTIDGVTYTHRRDAAGALRRQRQAGGARVAPHRRPAAQRPAGRRRGDVSSSSPTTTAPRAAAASRGWTARRSCWTRPTRTARRWCSTWQARHASTPAPTATGAWRRCPGVKLRFTSGAGGVAHLARYPQIRLVKDNGDGRRCTRSRRDASTAGPARGSAACRLTA